MSSATNDKKISKKGFISIRTKLLGIIIPVVALLVAVLSIVSYYISQGMIAKSTESLLKASVARQSALIEGWLDKNLSAFESVKANIQILPEEEDNTILQSVLDTYYNYDSNYPDGFYIASSDGSYFKATESTKSETDPLNSIWYKHGLTTVHMSLTDPYEDTDGNKIISASGMIERDSNVVSVLSVDLSLDKISVIVNSSVSMDGAESILVNTNTNSILANRNTDLIGTTLSTSNSDPFLASVATKIANHDYSFDTLNGNMTVMTEVGTTGWLLISYVPTSIIVADIQRLGVTMVIIGIIAIVILSIIIARVISVVLKPVGNLTKNIADMSQGDFTINIQHNGRDEIASMGESLEDFSKAMRNMISEISSSAVNLGEQSESSSNVSNEMYRSAKIQSESMSQLKDTVNQLSESVGDIAENATTLANVVALTRERGNDADAKMQETVEVSEKAKLKMQDVSIAMDKILASMSSLEIAINKVGTASEEITKIIELIGEIADETNLLSLNASIEAARAGEAGRGFAVVASEIGKLASNSTDSVHNISNLIDEIHHLVSDAVAQASESSKNINDSSSSVKGAVATFDEIFNNIQATNNLINEVLIKMGEVDNVATNVAAVSEEQAASSEEILSTSETMVEQADHITANSQKVADGSVDVAKTSDILLAHMRKFKIDVNTEDVVTEEADTNIDVDVDAEIDKEA